MMTTTPASAAPEDAYFKAAQIIYQTAQETSHEARQDGLKRVRGILDQIVEKFPASDLAVRILLQDTIEGLNVAALDAELLNAADAEPEKHSPIASPQPERSGKEIILEVQIELNRLGCAAGAADGIAGRNTKAAFAEFLAETDSDLTDEDLATEAAVSALKATPEKICKANERSQASALAGSWGWRTECPGLFNRVLVNRGSMNLRHVGGGRLEGSARNRQGNTGGGVVIINGNRATSVISYGIARIQANMTRTSTSPVTFVGRGTRNCRSVIWKS